MEPPPRIGGGAMVALFISQIVSRKIKFSQVFDMMCRAGESLAGTSIVRHLQQLSSAGASRAPPQEWL